MTQAATHEQNYLILSPSPCFNLLVSRLSSHGQAGIGVGHCRFREHDLGLKAGAKVPQHLPHYGNLVVCQINLHATLKREPLNSNSLHPETPSWPVPRGCSAADLLLASLAVDGSESGPALSNVQLCILSLFF